MLYFVVLYSHDVELGLHCRQSNLNYYDIHCGAKVKEI